MTELVSTSRCLRPQSSFLFLFLLFFRSNKASKAWPLAIAIAKLIPLLFAFFCPDMFSLLTLFWTNREITCYQKDSINLIANLNYFFRHLDFTQAIPSATGTIFFSGVGKSGFVTRKISTTLVSLGIHSCFLSPLDALHGDIGALSSGDVLALLSKSGSSEELLRIAPFARDRGAMLVSMLDQCCDLNVFLPLKRELCPFDLAPVTSAAIQMVFGDTVAVALMSARNLTKEVYATNHPAGKIGKSLVFKVKDLMKKQDELPLCKEGDSIMEQLVELTSMGCGCLLVIDDAHRLVGTFTDGDLRCTLKASKEGIFQLTVGEMCNRSPRTIDPNAMAVEAMKRMESPASPVQFLPVVDHQNVVIGIIMLHGLVSAGL